MDLLARTGGGKGDFRGDESAAAWIAEKRRGAKPRIGLRACDPVRGRRRPQSQQRNDPAQQNAPEDIANDAAQRIHLCELVCVVHPECCRCQPAYARPAAPDLPRPCVTLGSRSSVPRSVVNWEKQCQRKVEKRNGCQGNDEASSMLTGRLEDARTPLITSHLWNVLVIVRAASCRPEFVPLRRRA